MQFLRVDGHVSPFGHVRGQELMEWLIKVSIDRPWFSVEQCGADRSEADRQKRDDPKRQDPSHNDADVT